jgi:hypothetical protein
LDFSKIILNHEDRVYFLKNQFNQLEMDLLKTGKKIIVDSHDLTVKDVIKNFGTDCDIYCLGMPNQSPEKLLRRIRELESPDDWSYYAGDSVLHKLCERTIYKSKILMEECKKYGSLFFDTSGNREKKIMEAVRVIEYESINY